MGTHCDTLKPETEKERRKVELNHIIYNKYLVGHGPQQLREMGLPKILDVIYVGCPLNSRAEGVLELRNALYDIAFTLPANSKGESWGRRIFSLHLRTYRLPAFLLLLVCY